MYHSFKNKTELQIIISIILLNFVFLLPGLWVPFFNIDEITNAIHAHFINNGDLSLKDFLGSTYLLTHYLYALVYKFAPQNSLIPIHIVHALWQAVTIFALYWVGKDLDGKKTGVWAALFYCVFSHAFMSKDFYTPSAESFSLLPSVVAVGFIFRALKKNRWHEFFLAGFFAMLAAFFKAPMGIMIVAMLVMLLSQGSRFLKGIFVLLLGVTFIFVLPVCLIMPFGEGFRLLWDKLLETNALYVQVYEGFSFLYSALKFVIRTMLVFGIAVAMTTFAVYGLKPVFRLSQYKKDYWCKIFLLFVWLMLLWFTVFIGKRVFYHYYVFLLAPLSLLAGTGINRWKKRKHDYNQSTKANYFLVGFASFVQKNIAFLIILPAIVFFVDASFNISTRPESVDRAVEYVKEHTTSHDRIYIWGNIPQLYFYSSRLPSTVFFWSDVLAGTSPGSPAMEYVRVTKKNLNIHNMLMKDFQPLVFKTKDPNLYKTQGRLSGIHENELLTIEEMLERIDHLYWKKVFSDFLTKPPELFIDSSPANIRGFGFFPIEKYELLKRFVADNYELETVVDGLIMYRLKKQKVQS